MLNKIHERALRIAYGDYTSTFIQLLGKDSFIIIHERNIHALALEVFKRQTDFNTNFMKTIFSPVNQIYDTRHQSLTRPIPRTVTYGLESFGYRANEIWNSLPKEVQAAKDSKSFD